jgi:hypothetical protein
VEKDMASLWHEVPPCLEGVQLHMCRRPLLIVVAMAAFSIAQPLFAGTGGSCTSKAGSSFDPVSFGANINEALTNPLEAGKTELDLRLQVARILYDVRMMDGRTVRWLSTDIWPQYRCSSDPEDQRTGEIDPAWYAITRVLLEEAQKQDIRVVIVLTNLANGTFATLPREPSAAAQTIIRWADHRAAHPSGAYREAGSCDRNFRKGYYGEAAASDLFEDPTLLSRLTARSVSMARDLASFPALGAIELFNEPSFAATHTTSYALAVRRLRDAIRASVPTLCSVPIVSGTAWWDDGIVRAASEGGYLADEAYVSAHSYEDYTRPPAEIQKKLAGILGYLRRLVPGKPVAIAEAGSSTRLADLAENSAMTATLLAAAGRLNIGVWVWGQWIPSKDHEPDYKWTFNTRSPAGGSFRGLVTDPGHEALYAGGRAVTATGPGGQTRSARVTIRQEGSDDGDRWIVDIDGEAFAGASLAGVFPRPYPGEPAGFAVGPKGAVFLPLAAHDERWLEISYVGSARWHFDLRVCVAGGTGAVPTPLYVLALGRGILPSSCAASTTVLQGML